MYVSRKRLSVTCTASGATYFAEVTQGGLFYGMRYTPGTASAFATGSTCQLSVVGPGGLGAVNILLFTGTSAAAMLFPRFDSHTTAGVSGGTSGTIMMPLSAGDALKLTVASGGASGNGHFDLFLAGQW